MLKYPPIHGKWFLQIQISKKSDCGNRLLPLSFLSDWQDEIQKFGMQLANQATEDRETQGEEANPTICFFEIWICKNHLP